MNRGAAPWIALGVLLGGAVAALGPHFDSTRTVLAAMRVLDSQHIYRDFAIPEGPLAAWILAPILWLAPSVGWGTLIASAALNGVAVAAVWNIVARASHSMAAARNAAILTGIWFLPVLGTYYLDHVAYALVLLAFATYLSGMSAILRGALSGVLLALAYHAKQTVGVPAVAGLLVGILVVDGRAALRDRANAACAALMIVTHGVVLGIIAVTANLSDYYRYAVELPLQFGREDGRSAWKLLLALGLPFGIDPVEMVRVRGRGRLAFYPVVVAVYGTYAWIILRYGERARGRATARDPLLAVLLLLLSTLWSSILLGRLYAHVTFGLAAVVGLTTARLRPMIGNGMVTFAAMLGLMHVAVLNWPSAPFPHGLSRSELRPLMFADPDGAFDTIGAGEAIVYLGTRPGHIALLADSAEIIPIGLGRPTFEPVGDFFEVKSVPQEGQWLLDWEARFVGILERRQVRYLIGSDREVYSKRVLTPRAVGLWQYIGEHYRRAATFGRYYVLERRELVGSASAGARTPADLDVERPPR